MNYKDSPEIYKKAAELFKNTDNPSLSLLRVYLGLSYEDAQKIMEDFVTVGFISDFKAGDPKILKPVNAIESLSGLKQEHRLHNPSDSHSNSKGIIDFDSLEGHAFENFCADLLKYNGFNHIKVTSGSGDYGIDILCSKEEISYAIQCKCYQKKVGNKAVQEAVSGKVFYKCDKAVVMTNSTYTTAAQETARMTNTLLWERSHIKLFLDTAIRNGYRPGIY